MFRINKSIEYALIAIGHLQRVRNDGPVSTKGLATRYNLPHDLAAKILQRLTVAGILESQQGPRGGYRLAVSLEGLTFKQLSDALLGSEPEPECPGYRCSEAASCDGGEGCEIMEPVLNLDSRIRGLFSELTVAELLNRNIKERV